MQPVTICPHLRPLQAFVYILVCLLARKLQPCILVDLHMFPFFQDHLLNGTLYQVSQPVQRFTICYQWEHYSHSYTWYTTATVSLKISTVILTCRFDSVSHLSRPFIYLLIWLSDHRLINWLVMYWLIQILFNQLLWLPNWILINHLPNLLPNKNYWSDHQLPIQLPNQIQNNGLLINQLQIKLPNQILIYGLLISLQIRIVITN